MIIYIDRSFEKDTDRIRDKYLLSKIADCIEQIENAENIQAIKNIKKLQGTDKYYRIKLGDYRIGIQITNNTIEFIRCLPRKDIYKYFPK